MLRVFVPSWQIPSFFAICICISGIAAAQDATPTSQSPAHVHDESSTWSTAFDGVLFATVDRQTGRRGETKTVSQNWFMAMGTLRLGLGTLTLTGMVSAEPLTVGQPGYPELFQEGEAYRNLQITDRQHPHDLFMQLSAAWRWPIGDRAGFTLAGAPVGEAALGPPAFMHRPSAFENPTAPLSHHIFDSTHITEGVVTAGVDYRPLQIEASIFRGREPDEHRYDLDLGALDSWSVRGWFRSDAWTVQASHGFLHEPEQLEPGDQRRMNASVSWMRQSDDTHFIAATAAAGRTVRRFSTVRAYFAEVTAKSGRTSIYGRVEDVTVETEILLFPQIVHVPHPGELVDPIRALTAGGVFDVLRVGGFTLGVGADVTVYAVPGLLTFSYGASPRSTHVFVRLRPPARGRMWNMTMGQPMTEGEHAGHR